MYVGSSVLKGMYRRYRAHLFFAKGGSVLVNRAVKKNMELKIFPL